MNGYAVVIVFCSRRYCEELRLVKSGGITGKRRQREANQRLTRSAGSAQAAPRSGHGEDPEGGADVVYDDSDHSDADAEDWQSGVAFGRPWPNASRARRPLTSSFCSAFVGFIAVAISA